MAILFLKENFLVAALESRTLFDRDCCGGEDCLVVPLTSTEVSDGTERERLFLPASDFLLVVGLRTTVEPLAKRKEERTDRQIDRQTDREIDR